MADFQKNLAGLRAEEIDVVAASVDALEDARKLIAAEGLTYPIAYGLDAKTVATTLGSFFDADDPDLPYLQPADFVLAPNGTIVSATYSTSAIGRLGARDTLAFVSSKKQTGTS